jgi:hypothetical protein
MNKKTDIEMEDGETDVNYFSGAMKYFTLREVSKTIAIYMFLVHTSLHNNVATKYVG